MSRAASRGSGKSPGAKRKVKEAVKPASTAADAEGGAGVCVAEQVTAAVSGGIAEKLPSSAPEEEKAPGGKAAAEGIAAADKNKSRAKHGVQGWGWVKGGVLCR